MKFCNTVLVLVLFESQLCEMYFNGLNFAVAVSANVMFVGEINQMITLRQTVNTPEKYLPDKYALLENYFFFVL